MSSGEKRMAKNDALKDGREPSDVPAPPSYDADDIEVLKGLPRPRPRAIELPGGGRTRTPRARRWRAGWTRSRGRRVPPPCRGRSSS